MNREALYRKAFALLARAQELLLAARLRHEAALNSTLPHT